MSSDLRIPGPTPCPSDVLESMATPMINHRGPEFAELIERVTENTKLVLNTKNDLFFFTSSGTGSLEAAVVNTLSPGDKVLSIITGFFGERFAKIAEIYGAEVERIEFPLGEGADPDVIRTSLSADPKFKAVLVTHNDTSTGIANHLSEIAKIVKQEFGILLLVDAISSAGCLPIYTDIWECDVVATASQKGFMSPPGISLMTFSEQAWENYNKSTMPKSYFDVKQSLDFLEKGQTPWTPCLSVLFAVDTAVNQILAEGIEEVFRRHERLGEQTRAGVFEMGLELFPDLRYASNAITAVNVPSTIDGESLVDALRIEHNVIIGGGQGTLKGKIIRIGHMGYCFEEDVDRCLKAVSLAIDAI
jgi:aspartate aminotransferase-like enzyme